MRLISSGIVRSKLRSPASTWATRMPSFAAARETAMVELTSPTTRTRSGLRSTRTGSMRFRISAVCDAWEPEPTSGFACGEGMPIWREENVGELFVTVLAGVNKDGLDFRMALHLTHKQ